MTTATLNSPSATATIAAKLVVLGRLLSYPDTDFDKILAQALDTMDSLPLIAFRSALGALSPDEREELYTATFDVMPQCVPYVSIHLFGEENFKRGEFMAALHSRYAMLGFATGGELPDHLGILLPFTATLGEPERRELVEYCLLGPLANMILMLSPDQPYRALLESVDDVLRANYPGIQAALSPLEQMRRHGGACPAVSAGCGCGAPDADDPPPTP